MQPGFTTSLIFVLSITIIGAPSSSIDMSISAISLSRLPILSSVKNDAICDLS